MPRYSNHGFGYRFLCIGFRHCDTVAKESVPDYPRPRLEPTGKLVVVGFARALMNPHMAITMRLASGFPKISIAWVLLETK